MNDFKKKYFTIIIKFIMTTIANHAIKFLLTYKNDIYNYIKYYFAAKFK